MEDIIIKLLIVTVVTYLVLRIVAAIGKIPVHTYAEKLKCARDTRIVNKNLVRVPDLPTTTIMEKLRETIPFANSKIEEKDGMFKITCVGVAFCIAHARHITAVAPETLRTMIIARAQHGLERR